MRAFRGCYFLVCGILLLGLLGYWVEISDRFSNHSAWFPNPLFIQWKTDTTNVIVESDLTFNLSTTDSLLQVINSTSVPVLIPTNESESVNDSWNITLYITSHKLLGRLGNQMFIYASLLGIARAQNRIFIIPPGSYLGNTFKLQHEGDADGAKEWQVVNEAGYVSFDENLMNQPPKNVRINGYLQSFRYFENVVDEVRQEFTFQDSIANAAAMILDDVHAKNRGSLVIGVHVRRGDFLGHQDLGFGVPEKSYFLKAFSWMKLKFPGRNITFLVASDDLNWCRQNLIGNGVVDIMPPASPGVHMAILRNCDHVIISGGTFGYWSGWMATGYVVYYTGYLASNTRFGKTFTRRDYYPPLWIGFGN